MQKVCTLAVAFLLLVGPTACGGGGAAVTGPHLPTSETRAVRAAAAVSNAAGNVVVDIDAGGNGSIGDWSADTDYNGGIAISVSNTIDTSRVSNPAPQAVYQSQRYAAHLIYTIPRLVPNGAYSVVLQLAESYWNSAGQRLFDVSVNGTKELGNFDIYQAAGGANIAITKTFSTNADSNGTITVALTASRDNATVAGIQILDGAQSPGPTPAPTPPPAPNPSSGDALPWIYSELWSASSPFKTSVAQHKAAGATVVSHAYMDALWNEGIAGNSTAGGIPIYVANSSDPLRTTWCTMYGSNCNARNVQVHVPTYAVPQQEGDGHLTVIDTHAPGGPVEVDCWQTYLSGSSLQCSWAGAFTLGSAGTPVSGGEGIHGGMAVASVFTTGAEIAGGHIDHALGINTACLNDSAVYPAATANGTDTSCNGSSNPPHYGNLLHLLWSSDTIARSAYSAPCKVVLTALATYGGYLDDTGNTGLQINVQNELSYTANSATKDLDPWPNIQSQLDNGGDGLGNKHWNSCLNRLGSNDFELLQIRHS